jgi:hypothetical protein
MSTYTFHEDPGHGWLQVPRSELVRLGIAGQVSSYSYQAAGDVFLEEDCDLSLFMEAKEAKGEPKPTFQRAYLYNTPIRHYASYTESP